MQVQSNTVASTHANNSNAANRHYDGRKFAQPVLTLERSEGHRRQIDTGPQRTNASGTDDLATQPDLLYAEFRPLVRRLIRQYGENTEIRNDLEGEIYCRFCSLLKAYDPNRGVPLRPYLVRQLSASVYTFARHQWRSQHREVSLELFTSESEPRQSADPTLDWDDAIDLQRFKHSLPAVIAKLSERQRNVLIWRYYEDSSFEEIANRLGIQASTARSLLRHALNRLRANMAPAQ